MTVNLTARSKARHLACAHSGGSHRLAWREWLPAPALRSADSERRPVFCLHGLTRTGRDFDPLATRLAAAGHRVICPDLPGRGLSGWLPDGSSYEIKQYVGDCVALLDHLDLQAVDWIGTSLGGLVGMVLASRDGSPIERLVLNDIGPHIEQSGVERIRGYVGDRTVHVDFRAAERALRHTMRAFGPHDDAQFRVLSEHYFVPAPGGGLVAHYDPALADALVAGSVAATPDLWPHWDRIDVPVLVVRGGESDILSRATVERMRAGRKRRVSFIEIAGVGHAPTLIADDQIDAVMNWLAATATDAPTADVQRRPVT